MASGAAFHQNPNDPFCQAASSNTAEEETSSSWRSEEDGIVPKWTLLTTEEKREQTNVIKRLEAKLQRIGKLKENVYKYDAVPAMTHPTDLMSEDESLDAVSQKSINEGQEEEEEGLPLLWKDKSTSIRKVPHKSERSYEPIWRQWLCCCFN